MNKNRILTFTLLISFLFSCSYPVIKRDYRGNRVSKKVEKLTPIKKKLTLLQIYNESPFGGDDLGVMATEELRRELSRTGQFVIDMQGDTLFGSSRQIYAGGGQKLAQLSKKAKMMGLNFVIFGRIPRARVREKTDEIGIIRKTKSYSESKLELKVFDVNSNKEVYSNMFVGEVDDKTYRFYLTSNETRLSYRQELLRYAVRVAARKSVPHIVRVSSKLDWMGRVARIIGNKIYLNAGRKSGMNIGDILKVVTEGGEIYDPETGSLLGVSKGEIKGTIEIIDYFGPDGSIAILHSGGSVQEGDFVQLY
jgi:hypothetical protein